MTDPTDPFEFDEERLGGHTLDELSEYLESGRTPPDRSIDDSPECQLALASLARLRAASKTLIENDAASAPKPSDSWVSSIMANISREVRAGRDIPIANANPAVTLIVTEGSVRSLIRAAGDLVPGVLIGRCRLEGDVSLPGTPIIVAVAVTALGTRRLPELGQRVREAIHTMLRKHTELVIAAIDVTIEDVQLDPSAIQKGPRQ